MKRPWFRRKIARDTESNHVVVRDKMIPLSGMYNNILNKIRVITKD